MKKFLTVAVLAAPAGLVRSACGRTAEEPVENTSPADAGPVPGDMTPPPPDTVLPAGPSTTPPGTPSAPTGQTPPPPTLPADPAEATPDTMGPPPQR